MAIIQKVVLFEFNGQVLKLQLKSTNEVQVHYWRFRSLIGMLEIEHDVILTPDEEILLFIGTLPGSLAIQMACKDFIDVKSMVAYLLSPSRQVSHAYMDSEAKDMYGYDGDVSSTINSKDSYGDAYNDHLGKVCIPPCEEEQDISYAQKSKCGDFHGLKSLNSEEVSLAGCMESKGESIYMQPIAAMDMKTCDIVHGNAHMVLDTAMDMPIVDDWDLDL